MRGRSPTRVERRRDPLGRPRPSTARAGSRASGSPTVVRMVSRGFSELYGILEDGLHRAAIVAQLAGGRGRGRRGRGRRCPPPVGRSRRSTRRAVVRLAAAALADEPERLAAAQDEVHAVDRLHRADRAAQDRSARHREVLGERAGLQHHVARPSDDADAGTGAAPPPSATGDDRGRARRRAVGRRRRRAGTRPGARPRRPRAAGRPRCSGPRPAGSGRRSDSPPGRRRDPAAGPRWRSAARARGGASAGS